MVTEKLQRAAADESTCQLPRTGERIGSGVVLDKIDAGGTAIVYRTWCEQLELYRAVKVMTPDAGREIRERFATEAKIASKLIHPNIVLVHNYGYTGADWPYIEMEYVEGVTLNAVIRDRGALPLPVALAVAIGVLDALHYAHTINYTLNRQPQRGVMHRDIKPGNVILSGGIPKLTDFGIARPLNVSLHTEAGSVPGTIAYMAPETCTRAISDFRSDIYQVGVLLYECISGRKTFTETETAALVDSIKAGEYKALDTHPKAAAIVKKCMAIDPSLRYQTAQECLADVRALYHAQSPQIAPDAQILAFLQGQTATPATKATKAIPPAVKKGAKFALIAVPCFALALLLVVFGFTHGNKLLQAAIQNYALAKEPEPTPEPEPIGETPPPAQAKQAAAPTKQATPTAQAQTKQAAAPAKQAAPPAAAAPTPEDALYHINEGKRLLAQNKPQEALASFQTALKTPSEMKSRQEIIKLSIYGSAQCNTVLFRQGSAPRTNFETSWRSVQKNFPAGSPEHTAAVNHLKELEQ